MVYKCLHKVLNSHYNVTKPVTFVKANFEYSNLNRQAVIDLCEITVHSTFSLFEIWDG